MLSEKRACKSKHQSKHIQTHPNTSKHIQIHPNTSKHLKRLHKVHVRAPSCIVLPPVAVKVHTHPSKVRVQHLWGTPPSNRAKGDCKREWAKHRERERKRKTRMNVWENSEEEERETQRTKLNVSNYYPKFSQRINYEYSPKSTQSLLFSSKLFFSPLTHSLLLFHHTDQCPLHGADHPNGTETAYAWKTKRKRVCGSMGNPNPSKFPKRKRIKSVFAGWREGDLSVEDWHHIISDCKKRKKKKERNRENESKGKGRERERERATSAIPECFSYEYCGGKVWEKIIRETEKWPGWEYPCRSECAFVWRSMMRLSDRTNVRKRNRLLRVYERVFV